MGSIYQNNGYWYYQTYVIQTDGSRTRIQKTLRTKDRRVAIKRKQEWDKKVRKGLFSSPRIPFLPIIDQYLRERERLVDRGQLSPNTYHPDRVSFSAFKKFLSDYRDPLYLDHFEGDGGETIFREFIEYRTNLGRSPNTIRRELSHIRTLFSKLSKERSSSRPRIHDNPFTNLQRPRPTSRKNFPKHMDWELLRKFLRSRVRKKDEYDWFIWAIYVQIETGCRISEVLTMKWERGSDDYVGGSRTFSYLHNENTRWTIYFKRRERTLPIDQMGSASHRLSKVLSRIPRRDGSTYIFENPKTERPYLLNSTPKMFRRLLSTVGMKNGFTTHGLRHGFVSYLLNNGISTYQVGQIVGHSESQITEMYGHVDLDTISSALKQLR
ncbi:MAG: site-specific integrase [Gemmatimonadetes bacterium]|nr:site-specific integrase [Gemmatimonadota bacterium]